MARDEDKKPSLNMSEEKNGTGRRSMERSRILRAKDRDVLRIARSQAGVVRKLEEQLVRLRPAGPKGARLDGMPTGSRSNAGLDARLIRIEGLESMLARAKEALESDRVRARRAMCGMSAELFAFCQLYYIEAMTLEETAEVMGRSERQCRRYRSEVETAAEQ